jgi:cytochrome c oxidase assembly factor CtaG
VIEAMQIIPQQLGWLEFDVWTAANLLLLGLLYFVGVYRVHAAGQKWPIGRSISFALALFLLVIAYLGPFGAWAHAAFWPHMSQHLIVMMLVGPFIVLSNPVWLLFLNLSGSGRRKLVRVLRSKPVAIATTPWVGWVFFASVLLGSHIGPVMNLTIQDHDFMMFIERPLYLIAALVFYYPLLGNDLIAKRPDPSIRVLSLGLMMIPETTLGMVVHFAPVTLFDAYVEIAPLYGIDALTDQKFAGATMWATAMVIDGFWMMFAALEWWKDQEKRTRKMEREERAEQVARDTHV